MMIVDAILLGGGTGNRFSQSSPTPSSRPKQFEKIGQHEVFAQAAKRLLRLKTIRHLVLTMPAGFEEAAREALRQVALDHNTSFSVITGGNSRQESSWLALEELGRLNPHPSRVLIHDACRPNLSDDFLKQIQDHIEDRAFGAWIPVIPVTDTLKSVEDKRVVHTVDRSALRQVQTPQIFDYALIHSVAEQARKQPEDFFTDDASLCEHFGYPVGTFEGDVRNIKLTYEHEMVTLNHMLNAQTQPQELR